VWEWRHYSIQYNKTQITIGPGIASDRTKKCVLVCSYMAMELQSDVNKIKRHESHSGLKNLFEALGCWKRSVLSFKYMALSGSTVCEINNCFCVCMSYLDLRNFFSELILRCYNFFWSNSCRNHSSCKANTLVLCLKNTALHHCYQWQQVFLFWNYMLFQVLSLKNIEEHLWRRV